MLVFQDSGRMTGPGRGNRESQAADRLLLTQHDLGGFYDHRYRVADLQFHLLGASASDDGFDFVLAHLHDHMGHHGPKGHFTDLASKLVACREGHAPILHPTWNPEEFGKTNRANRTLQPAESRMDSASTGAFPTTPRLASLLPELF
jgi:hypothetical protein